MADQVGRVAIKTGPHRIALPGDTVGPRSWSTDIAGHQCQIDDRLGRSHTLVALVDTHRPPEGNALVPSDHCGNVRKTFCSNSRFFRDPIECVRSNVLLECLEL